jgi:hypothetical protein
MAVGPHNQPISRPVLEALPWPELVERLTAVAHFRLRRSVDDAKQLAMDTVRVFLDPKSTVTWDFVAEPDARMCLGSILNGLLRNFVRKQMNLERPTPDEDLEMIGVTPTNEDENPADVLVARDLFHRVLAGVAELSKHDAVATQLISLFRQGMMEVEEQAAELTLPKAAVYEARRRIRDRIAVARRALGEE